MDFYDDIVSQSSAVSLTPSRLANKKNLTHIHGKYDSIVQQKRFWKRTGRFNIVDDKGA
jgi:hypothetical protein